MVRRLLHPIPASTPRSRRNAVGVCRQTRVGLPGCRRTSSQRVILGRTSNIDVNIYLLTLKYKKKCDVNITCKTNTLKCDLMLML